MMNVTRSGHRSASAAVLIVGGGAIAVATWVGGDHGLAVGFVVFYLLAAGVAYWWSGGEGDVAAIMRVGGDERQRGLDRDAIAISGVAVAAAALVGAIVQTARGLDSGPYGVMCVVAGASYVVGLTVLRRRR
jgi:hypothetical protein